MKRLFVLWTALAWTACGVSAPEPPAVREAKAHVMPGGMGAVYFAIDNPGTESDRLMAAATASARAAEIHETVDENGVMRMVPHPGGVEIPAGGSVAFEPGGLHVMLIEAALPDGADTLRLTLEFERAGTIEVEAKVMPMGTMEHSH